MSVCRINNRNKNRHDSWATNEGLHPEHVDGDHY